MTCQDSSPAHQRLRPQALALSQEHALWLLKKRAVNKDWDKIMEPYWGSLPPQGTLTTKETFSRDSLDLLQDDSMVSVSSLFILPGTTQDTSARAKRSAFIS